MIFSSRGSFPSEHCYYVCCLHVDFDIVLTFSFRVAIDGPFGTASEVRLLPILSIFFLFPPPIFLFFIPTLIHSLCLNDSIFPPSFQDIFQHEVGLLVGGGIGVTPFASILKSIFYKLTDGNTQLRLKKVYFYWICPEIDSFEWFADLLINIERQLEEKGIRWVWF